MQKFERRAVLLSLACSLTPGRLLAGDTEAPELLVFAAASLTGVLEALSAGWTHESGVPVKLSFAASSILARQIEAGGGADVFVSADQEWMDYLAARKLIAPATRRDLAGNSLVLIAPADSRVGLTLSPGVDFSAALGTGRLATGDPATVPVGRYARAAFMSLGVWSQLEHRIVPADNVRAALNLVARGEVPLGVVYATDARAEKAVRIIATFPADSHPPIRYPAAVTSSGRQMAIRYLTYVSSPAAALTWRKYGFQELQP